VRGPGRIVPDAVYPSLEAAADHLRTTDEVTREEMVAFLSSAFYRREDGMYAWGPPQTSPAAVQAFGALESEWSEDFYEGIDVPVLAIRVQQSRALTRELEQRGFPQDSIDMAVRWATEYDDVANERGLERLVAAVPDAEIVVLDDVSHNFVILDPDVVARIINDFLDRFRR